MKEHGFCTQRESWLGVEVCSTQLVVSDFARPYLIRWLFMHRIRSEQKKTEKVIFHQQPAKKLSKSAKFENNQKKIYNFFSIHLRDKSRPSLERKYSVLSNGIGYLLSKNHSRALMGQNWSKTPKKSCKISLQGALGGGRGCPLGQHAYFLIQHDMGSAAWYKF